MAPRTSTLLPVNLRCEYLIEPLAVDEVQPRLSWELTCSDAARQNIRQTAYQIQVTRADGTPLWDSRRVTSAATYGVCYGGPALAAAERVRWQVRVWDEQGVASPYAAAASWTAGVAGVGWSQERAWDAPAPAVSAEWIAAPLADTWDEKVSPPATLLRRGFALAAPVKRAVLYASALGLYELRLNGQRVGDQVLAPEWTDYRLVAQYQGYDVTALLRAGDNALGALLGAGWYAGRIGMAENFTGAWRGVYGRRLALVAQLRVELVTGECVTVVTDRAWTCTTEGPIRSADLLDGEAYDARREQPGWDAPGFAAPGWAPVATLRGPRLVAQPNEPIRITRTLTPVALTEPQPGVYLFDLGQNMVGWARLTVRAPAGTALRLRYGEARQADGTLYRDNLRGAPQVDTYFCRGSGVEVMEPHFTYHGFRYVEVTGLAAAPALTDLTGCVFHSSGREVGQFACSNPLLDRIMAAIQWTQRGNLHSTPTDCPQRDERLGWMGDAQVFSQTAIFNMDMAAFFTKWARDIRDAQAEDGRFPDFAPQPYDLNHRFTGNPGWSDAGVVIPWRLYVNYGDTALLAAHYPAAKRYVDWCTARNPAGLWCDGSQLTPLWYGDWLNADTFADLANVPRKGGEVPKEIYATAFYAFSTQLVAQMAAVLGNEVDAAAYGALARQIRAAFNRAYVSKTGRITGDTQAGYALALNFDLLPAKLRPLAAKRMVAALKPYDGSLSTGIQSTVRLMLELSRHGYHREAYALMTKTTIPSWGYMVEHGGTTIWERWDGWVEGRGFQNPGMNSFNHYAIGAVGEWMWRVILGINPDETQPGYAHVIIRPIPGGGLTWARGTYHSIRGPITVAWQHTAGKFALELTLPPNITASVYLPGAKAAREVGSGTWQLACKVKRG